MNNNLKILFVDNPDLTEEIEAFCEKDPEYRSARDAFAEIAEEIAEIVGFDRYDAFERRFGAFKGRSDDLYYLFGLGLRQEVISALL